MPFNECPEPRERPPDPPKLSPEQERALEAAHAKTWRGVSQEEFETFLRNYPRPLEVVPRAASEGDTRVWIDPTLGEGIEFVALSRGSYGYELRRVLATEP